MFALGLRYLNGWAMAAADGARKERAEWPPHPDRVFMALAAAWFETGQETDEGAALRWLESLPPPGITASDAKPRTGSGGGKPTVSYVPVNDTERGRKPPDTHDLGKLKDAGLALLPEHRSRQARAFPVAIPAEPDVYLSWKDGIPEPHRAPLLSLCRKVASVGHSASFVQMWLEDSPPAANWVPAEGIGAHRLRVFGPGRLDDLERRCNRENVIAWGELEARIDSAKAKEKKMLKEQLSERFPTEPVSLRPVPGLWQGYAKAEKREDEEPPGSLFDPRLVVLSLSGQRLSLHATLKLTETLRGAMLAACQKAMPTLPEWLSGHTPDGRATALPHVALLPLPFVGHEHADGRIMGLALALPHADGPGGFDPAEAAAFFDPWLREANGLPNPLRLFDGKSLDVQAELEIRESPPASLRSAVWTRSARRWASVTPVVLDRHCEGKDKWDKAAEVVKDACERIGLPRPLDVLLHQDSLVRGVPRASQFPYLARKSDGGRMHHAHAVLVFGEEVQGPVMIGAGRFRGYGLCRPLPQGGESHG
jgi:CRISPR-associated protein Csb2